MPPLRERTPLSSLTAGAKPAWIAPFGNGLELRQAAKSPFPIVRIKARSRQIIVTQPHKGPSAARLKQKFDRRLPRRYAADATPGKNDFAIGHNLDVRSEEHTSELQSLRHIVCILLIEKKL